jgi:hypothetical protein
VANKEAEATAARAAEKLPRLVRSRHAKT